MPDAARQGPSFPGWLDDLLEDALTPGLVAERLDREGVTLFQPWHAGLIGNPWRGHVHGGALTGLLDKGTRVAALAVLDPGERVMPLDLRIDHLAPTLARHGLRVRAACYRLTRTVAFVRGTVTEGNARATVVMGTSSLVRTTAGDE